ncbi:hypothetical protein AAC387_Pa02g3147 [Persea americana]
MKWVLILNNAPLNRWTLDAPVSVLEFSSGGHYLWMGHVDCYAGEWVFHLIVSIHLEIILSPSFVSVALQQGHGSNGKYIVPSDALSDSHERQVFPWF